MCRHTWKPTGGRFPRQAIVLPDGADLVGKLLGGGEPAMCQTFVAIRRKSHSELVVINVMRLTGPQRGSSSVTAIGTSKMNRA
ncbi:hypothetical protein O206_15245 [Ochrobactrum sp. EGD-AQ16]|nr:hypothetical protein O206_15245 [Ochrobactrum sp. EGD-AQ16]